MHVFTSLDDALHDLRKTLLTLPASKTVLIKVVDEAEQELYACRIEGESTEDDLRGAIQDAENPCEAMEVDDSDISTASTSESAESAAFSSVTDEVEMGASMQQLVDAADSKQASSPEVEDSESGVVVADTTFESEEGDDVTSVTPRRSDRQRQPIEHASPLSRVKRKSALVVVPYKRTKKVKQRDIDVHRRGQPDDDGDKPDNSDQTDESEMQIVALTTQLKEAYGRRSAVDVGVDPSSPSQTLELVRQVLSQPGPDSQQSQGGSLLHQCATRVTSLITTSSAQKMIGYYLRSVLAHHLKRSSRRQYTRLARQVLGIKSSTDIAAYPAFFDFVQRHCPSIAEATARGNVTEEVVSQWLGEPLFIADISWTEWRRYLSKSHLHITEAAVQRFLASIESFKDWMQLGWVEIYDDEQLGGQGVRALRDIHLPSSRTQWSASISAVAADLHRAGAEFVKVNDPTLGVDPEYLIQLDQQRVFDARHHWVGKINHLPMPHCNLKVTGNGKLVQTKPIKVGDTLTFDYGVDYWVYQVTGLDISEWLSEGGSVCQRSRLDLFTRMHESVLDFSKMLPKKWARSLSLSSSVDREALLVDLEDCLDACHSDMRFP